MSYDVRRVLWTLLFVVGCAQAQHPAHAPSGKHHRDHSFAGAEEWAKRFDDPSRDAWQRPEAVLDRLELRLDTKVADIGSGTGYFAVRIARRVPAGRVWGIDIEPDMVRYLNERARRDGVANLFSTLGTPNDPLLPEPVDLVLIVNTYHHISARPEYFARLRSGLPAGARIAIVDFEMGEIPAGPPEAMRILPEQVQQEMEQAGYQTVAIDRDLLEFQYVAIFAVPSD